MAQTAEEKVARDFTKDVNNQLYGIHKAGGLISGDSSLLEIYNRYMILRVLEDVEVDNWLTADEKAQLEGKLIIKS
jgi:hypothetical protein